MLRSRLFRNYPRTLRHYTKTATMSLKVHPIPSHPQPANNPKRKNRQSPPKMPAPSTKTLWK